MFTNDTMKGRKNMINAKKIIASAVFFASLLGSLAFKPTIEKNKPLFETNRALNNLLSVEKYVEEDPNKAPLDMVADLLDPTKKHEKEEDIEDKVFTIDKEKLARYINRESNTYSYIDAFKEIQEDLFEGKRKSEIADIKQAIRDCSQETIESKLFLNSMFDTTYTSENIEEKMVELRFDDTPSIMAPYNTLNFDFDEWLIDKGIELEHKEEILEEDFSFVPENIITTNPRRAAATMILVGGTYFAESGLIGFIAAKLGVLFSTIAGAIKAFVTSVIIPYIGWILAAAVIVALTVIIILNWSKIVECFEHIKAWFIYKASKFAQKITALFSSMAGQSATKVMDDAYTNTNSLIPLGKWTKSGLKNKLKQCLFAGGVALTIEEFIRNTKYVYLGKFQLPNSIDNKDYIQQAKANGGLYYYTSQAISNFIKNSMGGNYWALNLFFLEVAMLSGKLFKLCTTPSKYYNVDTRSYVESSPCSYAKELRTIHQNPVNSVYWYNWEPVIVTTRR